MASGWSTELRVGLFALAGLGLITLSYFYFIDGVAPGEDAYSVSLTVPSADGLWVGTPVRIAGVDVGSIEAIALDGNQATIRLLVRSKFPLPVDTVAALRASGILGDRYVALDLGSSETVIQDGGRIELGEEPPNIDEVTRQVEAISGDIKAITAVLREMAEDERNVDHIEATLANVDALTLELARMAQQNREDIHAIVEAIRSVTDRLDSFSEDATADLDDELGALKAATDKLDATLGNLQSVTGKIDAGHGTIGALINDRDTVDALNETLEGANSVVDSFAGLRAEVYYLGRAYVGSQPSDPAFFYGNPLAPNLDGGLGYSGSNTLGIGLYPQEDFWWSVEIVDYPQGSISAVEHYYPDSGVAWTEYERKLDYRFTFMMNKRWYDVAFRLGVKEDGGGVGVTGFLFRDRLTLNADLFDFAFGSYPALKSSGLPNLRLGARWEPVDHLWLEAGSEQVLLGAKYDYFTGYVGFGFHFTDDDIKLLLATIPVSL